MQSLPIPPTNHEHVWDENIEELISTIGKKVFTAQSNSSSSLDHLTNKGWFSKALNPLSHLIPSFWKPPIVSQVKEEKTLPPVEEQTSVVLQPRVPFKPKIMLPPLGIPNPNTACYRNATNQALRVFHPLMHKMRTPFATDDLLKKNKIVFMNRQRIFNSLHLLFTKIDAKEPLINIFAQMKIVQSSINKNQLIDHPVFYQKMKEAFDDFQKQYKDIPARKKLVHAVLYQDDVVNLYKREQLRQSFVNFLDCLEDTSNLSALEKTDKIGKAEIALRDAIFSSQFEDIPSDLRDCVDSSRSSYPQRQAQQDAAQYLLTVLSAIMGLKFESKTTTTAKGIDRLEKGVKKPGEDIVSVKHESILPYITTSIPAQGLAPFQMLIDATFVEEINSATDNTQSPFRLNSEISYSKYKRTTQLHPNHAGIVPIHVKRFTGEGNKIETALIYPPNDHFNFSNVFDTDQPLQAQLKSFVVHLGASLNSGHYIAFVKEGSKWYECNDLSVDEVTQAKIDQMKQKAYLVFLELKE